MARISGTVSGLDPDTTYQFQVRVVDRFGNPGDWSNTATGTTLAEPEPTNNLLYFHAMIYSEEIYSTHNAVEFHFILTIPGLGTYTFNRSLSPKTVTESARDIARDDGDGGGFTSRADPSDTNQIVCGEWFTVDLAELRLAYPSFSTLTVEMKAAAVYNTGDGLANADVGARAHTVSGTPVYYDGEGEEPATFFPYQLLPVGNPLHDPAMAVNQSEVVNTGSYASYDLGPVGSTYNWSALVAAMTTIATFSYDDGTGTLTIS